MVQAAEVRSGERPHIIANEEVDAVARIGGRSRVAGARLRRWALARRAHGSSSALRSPPLAAVRGRGTPGRDPAPGWTHLEARTPRAGGVREHGLPGRAAAERRPPRPRSRKGADRCRGVLSDQLHHREPRPLPAFTRRAGRGARGGAQVRLPDRGRVRPVPLRSVPRVLLAGPRRDGLEGVPALPDGAGAARPGFDAGRRPGDQPAAQPRAHLGHPLRRPAHGPRVSDPPLRGRSRATDRVLAGASRLSPPSFETVPVSAGGSVRSRGTS